MFDRVTAALNASHLAEEYMEKFKDEKVTDDAVITCLKNPQGLILLKEVIPVAGDRMKFISEFYSTGTTNKQQHEQAKRRRTSRSQEIIIVDEEAVPNNSSTPSSTTTTQVKIEPSSSSSCSFTSFYSQNPTTTDFTSLIKNAYDKGAKLYTTKMNDLLGAPGFFLEESTLIEKHEENRSIAIEHFSSSYEQYKNSMSQVEIKSEDGEIENVSIKMEKENEENFNVKMSDFHDDISKKFEEYQEKNDLRRDNYISKANNFKNEAEKLYIGKMKKFLKTCTDEDELKEKEKEVNEEVVKYLNSNIENSQATSEFIQKLNDDLKESLNKWFEDHLELFQFRLEEDELDVTRAFDAAKKYYNDEMEKEFNSGNFIKPAQLAKIDKKISSATLKMCKEKNPDLNLNDSQEKQLKEAMKVIYKKYEDKNLLRKPTTSYAIGIDLGTTNSCVTVYRNGKVEVIHNEDGYKTTPSFVCFQDDSVLVGDVAKDQSYANPENTIFDSKRLIGRNFSDEKVQENIKTWSFDVVNENNKPKIRIGVKNSDDCPPPVKKQNKSDNNKNDSVSFKTYHAEQISALVLRKMKKIAEDYLGIEVKDAVITVPALFNDYQRQATKDSGEIAGLNVLRIINEPTAAAIAYNLHRKDDLKRNVLVFDLGGGTLDVVVLQIVKGEINVKSVHGDTHLGGQDFDTEMMKYCIEHFKTQHGIDLARDQDSTNSAKRFDASSRLRRIRNECERKKKVLSSNIKTIVGIDAIEMEPKLLSLHVPFTRELFESLNQKNFDRCLEIVQLALDEAKMSKSDIKDIILTGGSSRIPRIQKMISDFFGGKVLSKSINPDEAVAEGAGIQACILSGQQVDGVNKLKLNDVTPFSIGIKESNGKLAVQIPKNSPLPRTVTQVWQTPCDYETAVRFQIFEGENKIADKNNLLGRYVLEGIPSKKAGEERLPTTTTVNEEGILHVKSVCESSGTSSELTVTTFNNRMTRKEIEDAKVFVSSLME